MTLITQSLKLTPLPLIKGEAGWGYVFLLHAMLGPLAGV